MSVQQDPGIPTLPANSVLEYLAEGAANIVYRVHVATPPSSSPSNHADHRQPLSPANVVPPPPPCPRILQGRLLRLRKCLPSTVPNIQSALKHRDIFQPLFPPESLVAQDLIRLLPDTIPDANRRLRHAEATGVRPTRRRGVYIAENEPFGVLVTDMTVNPTARGERSFEFKPKWLAQSPTAPPDAKRCRTCALRAQRNATRRRRGERLESSFCPLDLLSNDVMRLQDAVRYIMAANHAHNDDDDAQLQHHLISFLQTNTLLPRIRRLQTHLDPHGILHERHPSSCTSTNFLIATTLRDCTVFLKIHPDKDDHHIEARIGDLDLKSPGGGKFDYWRSVEESLIAGGWYTATETEEHDDHAHDRFLLDGSSSSSAAAAAAEQPQQQPQQQDLLENRRTWCRGLQSLETR